MAPLSELIARLRTECDCTPPVKADQNCVVGELRERVATVARPVLDTEPLVETYVRFHDVRRLMTDKRV